MSDPSYVCPRCRAPVEREPEGYRCPDCSARYPIVCGIADFRVYPDPYIGLEADRAKARGLAEHAHATTFEGLVRHYFAITPEVPPPLARSYLATILDAGPARAESLLEAFAPDLDRRGPRLRVLDLGCGSGTAFAALGRRYPRVAGADIALRWLVAARKRLDELGREAELVCACADRLPFSGGGFDLVLLGNVIEHVPDPQGLLAESARVLGAGGALLVATPNRFSLGPDPHVGLWGAGFLPAGLRDRYARRFRGVGYDKVRTLGFLELRRMLAAAGFAGGRFLVPDLTPSDLARLGPVGRLAGRSYRLVRRIPVARSLLVAAAPFFQAVKFRPS